MAQTPDSQIEQWFHTVDTDHTGRLTAEQLQQALRNTDTRSTFDMQVVHLMISLFDHDNTRTITLIEFKQLWAYLDQWRQSFMRFDLDKTGNITRSELEQAIVALGYTFTAQFFDMLMHRFDFRKVGTLQFDGFVHAIVLIQRLTSAFQMYDTQRSGNATFTYEDFLTVVMTNT
jgi:Ca2+-binding EF-hand superfamily protein